MTTATDIIRSALENIGATAAGESDNSADFTAAFARLNRLIDQLSLQSKAIYQLSNVIFNIVPQVQSYTIGQPNSTTAAQAQASYNGAGKLLTIASVTNGSVALGQVVANPAGAGIPATMRIISVNPNSDSQAAGGVTFGPGNYGVDKIGVNYATTGITLYYERPARVVNAFVRSSNLDYPVACISQEQYSRIGQKQLAGPWPRALYYEAGNPEGIFHLWPLPAGGQMHVTVEQLLRPFTDTTTVILFPTGYDALLEWELSEYLLPSFGKMNDTNLVGFVHNKKIEARALIKNANRVPQAPSRMDQIPLQHRANDAGWILTGGFLP